MIIIDKFRDEYSFLSNFYEAPITINGYKFTNTEAAFQPFKDLTQQKSFTSLNPKQAKSMGRKVYVRKDWKIIKNNIMYEIVIAKLSPIAPE